MTAATSIRTFIGAKDYTQSRAFYKALGFVEVPLGGKMSYFRVNENLGFYLQDYYVKDWVENSMVFLEVEELDAQHTIIRSLQLPSHFPGSRVSDIQENDWGREFFVHDPSGVLWHIGAFKQGPLGNPPASLPPAGP